MSGERNQWLGAFCVFIFLLPSACFPETKSPPKQDEMTSPAGDNDPDYVNGLAWVFKMAADGPDFKVLKGTYDYGFVTGRAERATERVKDAAEDEVLGCYFAVTKLINQSDPAHIRLAGEMKERCHKPIAPDVQSAKFEGPRYARTRMLVMSRTADASPSLKDAILAALGYGYIFGYGESQKTDRVFLTAGCLKGAQLVFKTGVPPSMPTNEIEYLCKVTFPHETLEKISRAREKVNERYRMLHPDKPEHLQGP